MTTGFDLDEIERLLAAAALDDLPGYAVTPDGNVYSVAHNWRGKGIRKLSPYPNSHGYLRVKVSIGGKSKTAFVHKLVARAFHGEKPTAEHEVRHLDGCRTNNAASNLAWGTRSENAKDRSAHGRSRSAENGKAGASKTRGELSCNALLTPSDVIEIKRRAACGERPWAIAKSYPHASPFTISNVVRGRTWRHIEARAALGEPQ